MGAEPMLPTSEPPTLDAKPASAARTRL